MFKRKEEGILINIDKIDTVLGKEAEFCGKVKAAGILRIEGKFEGEIESSGDLILSETSTVNAKIKAKNAIIAGSQYGNVNLEGKLEIKNTGKIFGDIKVNSITIEEGGVLEGKCSMDNKNVHSAVESQGNVTLASNKGIQTD